ncbi:MAG: NUDIX domain-containing protein [Puniceicoccales bacterium]|jgi:8-oxo-dGTP pyrophosphatase MutT (NUDIX family)|nr:NUDIX domain-containing protein [Puniceicoccales bacterium]
MKVVLHRSTAAKIIALMVVSSILCSDVSAVREEKINKIEVFVSAYCYRINKVKGPEILLLKRSPNRKLSPGLWECGGGSVHENENFEDAAKRQLLEETGITATRWKTTECFAVEVAPGEIVPGIAFTCKASSDAQVKIDPREHTDFRWASIDELDDIVLVSPNMRKSVVKLLMMQDKLF